MRRAMPRPRSSESIGEPGLEGGNVLFIGYLQGNYSSVYYILGSFHFSKSTRPEGQ